MFSKSDTQYKSQKSGYRKYVWAAIGASAAMLGGLTFFGSDQKEDYFHAEAGEHFVNFLSNHRDYLVSTHNAVVDFIAEGHERKSETRKAILAIQQLPKSNKVDMKGKTIPALDNGSKQISKNVDFGERTTTGTVKPEEVTKSFSDSA
jgi:hypothetical protein